MAAIVEVDFVGENVFLAYSDGTSDVFSRELLAEVVRERSDAEFAPPGRVTERVRHGNSGELKQLREA